MKIGDLVRVNSQIDEYVDELGETIGVIIDISDDDTLTVPLIAEVLWSSGELESLYSDELDLISVK